MEPGRHSSDIKRLSHDVKNALNGVAVNLEVARSRITRGAEDPTQVVPFLDNAVQQLDVATKLHKQFAEFMLALTQY